MYPPIGSPNSFRSAAANAEAGPSRPREGSVTSIASASTSRSTQSESAAVRNYMMKMALEKAGPQSKMWQDHAKAVRLAEKNMAKKRADEDAAAAIGEALLLAEDPFEYDANARVIDDYFGPSPSGTPEPHPYRTISPLDIHRPGPPVAPLPEVPASSAFRDTSPYHPANIPPRPAAPADSMFGSPPASDYMSEASFGHLIPHPSVAKSPPPPAPPRDFARRNAAPSVAHMFGDTRLSQNALAVHWKGHADQTFALVTDPPMSTGSPYPVPREFELSVSPSMTQVIEVPQSWAGYVQKVTGKFDDAATRAEVVFDGYKKMTFFGVSYVYGNNGPCVMQSSSGDTVAGSRFRATDVAPASIVLHEAGRRATICGTSWGTTARRADVRRFYNEFLHAPYLGQVDADDFRYTQATHDRHLLLEFL